MIRGELRLSPGTCPDKFVEKKRALVYSPRDRSVTAYFVRIAGSLRDKYTQREAKDGVPAGNHRKTGSNR